ncbi:MAG: peptidylprolyl isomerase [Actinomycetota bacterium]
MTRPLPRSCAFVALAFVALVLSACSDAPGGGPAASVGDAQITDEQLQADLAAFRFLAGLSGAPCGTPAQGETQDAACARVALTNGIQEEIVKAYAVANDLSVEAAEVDDAVGELEESLGGPQELDAQLEAAGFTRAGLQALAERLLLFNVVQEAIVEERVDDEALQALYEESTPQFTTVEVAHILLETREEAEEVADEATPDNFAKLAQQRSIDPGSAPSGGSLGSFSEAEYRQQFDPTFVDASLALQPGEISGVVETQFGFHVIELLRRDVASFEDVRDQLVAQEGAQVFEDWLGEQYDAVVIEVNPRYGRLDATTRQVVAIRSTGDGTGTTGATGGTGIGGATGASGPTGITAP